MPAPLRRRPDDVRRRRRRGACRSARPTLDGPARSGAPPAPRPRCSPIAAGCGSGGSFGGRGSRSRWSSSLSSLLWTVARFVPLERRADRAAAIPLDRAARLADRRRARPTAARRDGAGGRCRGRRSATVSRAPWNWPWRFRLRGAVRRRDLELDVPDPLDEAAETDRFVRRQRRDALALARTAPPGLFRPRFSRQPADGRAGRGAPARPGDPAPEPAGRRDRPAAAGPRGRRPAGGEDRSRRGRARRQGPGRQRSADAAGPGAARPRAPVARAPERPRREPRPPRCDRDRRPRPDRPGERAARGVADGAEPRAVERRDRQARREPRRRSREGAGGPEGSRRRSSTG